MTHPDPTPPPRESVVLDGHTYLRLDPTRFPCRVQDTRGCPRVYDTGCPGKCARFDSDDDTPWLAELAQEQPSREVPVAVRVVLRDDEGKIIFYLTVREQSFWMIREKLPPAASIEIRIIDPNGVPL